MWEGRLGRHVSSSAYHALLTASAACLHKISSASCHDLLILIGGLLKQTGLCRGVCNMINALGIIVL